MMNKMEVRHIFSDYFGNFSSKDFFLFAGEEKQVAFWGVVSTALSNDGQSNLPPKDDEEVVKMTNIMFIFFLVCIGILLVYLVCSILLIYGAAKVNTIFEYISSNYCSL